MGMHDSRKLVDLLLWVHAETPRAWRVSEHDDKEDAVWLPKSLTEVGPERADGRREVTIPAWLAIERGLEAAVE